MKLNVFTSLLSAAVILAATNAQAENYIELDLYGVSLSDDKVDYSNGASVKYDTDFGAGAGIALGTDVAKNVRAEAEFAYRNNDVNAAGIGGEFESYALMGNAILDIPTGGSLTPYIGAGIGYANVTDGDVDDNVFAYQAMLGVSYAVTEKTDVVVGYKYFATTTPEYEVAGLKAEAPYETHNFQLGFRFGF